MKPSHTLARWFDVRPDEIRSVSLSLAGAFLIIGFAVVARSLREAFYLSVFEVKTLPYIMAAVAVLSFPTVGLFARLLSRYHPTRVVRWLSLVVGVGLLALWPVAMAGRVAVVVFYIWTALATLLLTSGFWIVTSEYFPVRGAKRLYGIIAAGGTAGALIMGMSLSWITQWLELIWLTSILLAMLALFFCLQCLLPRREAVSQPASSDDQSKSTPIGESLRLVWNTRHLRLIALLVLSATMASALVDYQFKELVRLSVDTTEGLTGFFGAFYGWAGGIALVIQLVVANRIMGSAGIAATLAILPGLLLLGSAGFLVVPGLVLITVLRGADYSLRKSLHRPALEILHVPLPAMLRRKTKTFINSVVDSGAEGMGAALIFFWVTLSGLPSRFLSAFVIVLALLFFLVSRRMGRQYHDTIVDRMQEEAGPGNLMATPDMTQEGLLTANFTQFDLKSLVADVDILPERHRGEVVEGVEALPDTKIPQPPDVLTRLTSSNSQTVLQAIGEIEFWDEEHVTAVTHLLARDSLRVQISDILTGLGGQAVPHLAKLLRDDDADFVIRRRIPAVLARVGGAEADDALLDALSARRFEVRYRSAIALVRRRERGRPTSRRRWGELVWAAIDFETSRQRPVWELQRLLDPDDPADDKFVRERAGIRGELSLEHTFRMLSLVLEPEPVRAAFHGIILNDENLKNFTLEYLDQVLPRAIQKRIWAFIGDMSDYQQEKSKRSKDEVAKDLLNTEATFLAGKKEREALKRMLEEKDDTGRA